MFMLIASINDFFAKMFASSSMQADEINRLFLYFIILSFVILFVVGFMVIGGIVRFRADKQGEGEPKQITGNKRLELIWTVIPLVIVVWLFFISLKAMNKINDPIADGKKPDIEIIAHQWWWDFRYPQKGVVTANELHIPVGKKLLMKVEAADVIHSWWVPSLGRKIDAIPGRSNYAWIEADEAGTYDGACSEYCGAEHAWMRIKVIAEPEEEYEAWLQHEKQHAPLPTDSLAVLGAKLFQQKTCGSCHAISGTPARAHIAPDLSHFASRKTILSGMMENSKENLRRWLEDPQKLKEGSQMPNFRMKKQEIDALTHYLETLK